MEQDILHFWFKEIDPSKWWMKSADFDQYVQKRFGDIHKKATQCELYHWRSYAIGRLAEIIVLDQFSRNIYRNTPLAFANDSLALALSQEAIQNQADKTLTPIENSFLYLPFMHSESKVIHTIAVDLYKKNNHQQSYEFELKHQAIIEQFNRYPHRNKILKRVSTPKEIEFLKQADSSF